MSLLKLKNGIVDFYRVTKGSPFHPKNTNQQKIDPTPEGGTVSQKFENSQFFLAIWKI